MLVNRQAQKKVGFGLIFRVTLADGGQSGARGRLVLSKG
jgi:hypothetical protein